MPANNRPRIGVDDEGDVRKTRPGTHVGQVGDPEPIGCRRMDVALDEIGRPWRRLVRDGCPRPVPAYNAAETQAAHEAFNGTACDGHALTLRLSPELPHPIDAEMGSVHLPQLDLQSLIP